MSSSVTGNQLRDRIVRIFASAPRMRFIEIARVTGMRTNHLAYHLNALLTAGLLRRQGKRYALTAKGRRVLPALIGPTGPDVPLVVVLVAVERQDGAVLLLRRREQPHKDRWSLPGGRLRIDETIRSAAERIVMSKTGVPVAAHECQGVGHEMLIADDGTAHTFILLLVQATLRDAGTPTRNARWFRTLPSTMIESDRDMFRKRRRVQVQGFTKRI